MLGRRVAPVPAKLPAHRAQMHAGGCLAQVLGEYALGLVALYYLAPPLLKGTFGALRGYAGARWRQLTGVCLLAAGMAGLATVFDKLVVPFCREPVKAA